MFRKITTLITFEAQFVPFKHRYSPSRPIFCCGVAFEGYEKMAPASPTDKGTPQDQPQQSNQDDRKLLSALKRSPSAGLHPSEQLVQVVPAACAYTDIRSNSYDPRGETIANIFIFNRRPKFLAR